jgi:hypothetical protein
MHLHICVPLCEHICHMYYIVATFTQEFVDGYTYRYSYATIANFGMLYKMMKLASWKERILIFEFIGIIKKTLVKTKKTYKSK